MERERHKLEARREQIRNRPIASVNFMIAGVHFEGREAVIRRHVKEDDTVYLARDCNNKYSRNAIAVILKNGLQIGFVPEEVSVKLSPLLDNDARHVAYVKKILSGGRVPIPVVQTYLYDAEATVESAVLQEDIPSSLPH